MSDDDCDCIEQIYILAKETGVDITVTREPPLVIGPYTVPPFICYHGVSHWAEPTGEQIAYWVKHKIP